MASRRSLFAFFSVDGKTSVVQTARSRFIFRSLCVKPVKPVEFRAENSEAAAEHGSTDVGAEFMRSDRINATIIQRRI